MTPKRVVILGSTGSIGCSTIDIIMRHRDRFEVEALVGNSNIALLAEQAKAVGARLATTADPSLYEDLKNALAGTSIEVTAGSQAVVEAAGRPAELAVAAMVGAAGLAPAMAAARRGTAIALANKESLVCAGELLKAECKRSGAKLLPVDSEHSAVFQCFEEHNGRQVEKITLTASGGPFRTTPLATLRSVTPEQALKHPNWTMGRKVTIDSATLMNKGLEVIEAYHLFPVSLRQLDILVHPQSIVHSLVSYVDGSVLAQLGMPDMRTPISLALAWPSRTEIPVARLDLAQIGTLTFEAVDSQRFPAPDLCRASLERGGNATTILNAANEVAVAQFLSKSIGFLAITTLVERVLAGAEREGMVGPLGSLEDVWAADSYARIAATELSNALQH